MKRQGKTKRSECMWRSVGEKANGEQRREAWGRHKGKRDETAKAVEAKQEGYGKVACCRVCVSHMFWIPQDGGGVRGGGGAVF